VDPVALAIVIIFGLVILSVSLEKANKAVAALFGAVLVYLLLAKIENLTFEDVIRFIDFKVIVFLMGFSIIVVSAREAGLFHYIALRAVKLSKGEPIRLFIILCLLTTILAMFATAMATIIVMGILTITIARMLKVDPVPYLLAEAIIVDVGGMTFLFSSAPNIILAQKAGLSFAFFAINTAPFVLIMVVFTIWYLLRLMKLRLGYVDPVRKILIAEIDEWIFIEDIRVFQKSSIIFAGTILGLILIPEFHIVALTGAILMLTLSGIDVGEALRSLDWETILFFCGLYVIVGGLEHKGILHEVGHILGELTPSDPILMSVMILWIVGLSSGVIDNVPVTLTFASIVKTMAETAGLTAYMDIIWTAMIFGTNLGGNLFPYGSPTTVLAMGIGEKSGEGFKPVEFMKVGTKWTFLSLALATAYLLARATLMALYRIYGMLVVYSFVVVLCALIVMLIYKYHLMGGIIRQIRRLKKYLNKLSRIAFIELKELYQKIREIKGRIK